MSTTKTIFDSYTLGKLSLNNSIVMCPLTRSRATADHIPTPIMAAYYGERASAGLIITEGTSPSPNGVGYPRIPGLYNEAQVAAWKVATDAVHTNGGKIFVQLMHTGRVSHPGNMSDDATIFAPSAIAPEDTKMYVDGEGELDIPTPTPMSAKDIKDVIQEYADAATFAMAAGFDGVEVHAANGYLLDQFQNPGTNHREDPYGGSHENRCRLTLDVVDATIAAIGKEKVGIRISPNGAMNDLGPFDGQEETFTYLTSELAKRDITYMHLVNHKAMGAPALPDDIREMIRETFPNTVILSGGYDKESANKDVADGKGDLIAFGRPFISNPDLVYRMKENKDLADPNPDTFYTPGKEGYIDYPKLEKVQ